MQNGAINYYPIPDYPNYLISKEGQVYSNKLKKNLVFDTIKGGYKRVLLYNKSGSKRFMVHRLVASTFIPNKEDKAEVNHINGDKNDNSLLNLEWNTTKENHKHAELTGLKAKGETHGMSKLTDKQRQEIVEKYIPWKMSSEMLGREYGVTGKAILYVLKTFKK